MPPVMPPPLRDALRPLATSFVPEIAGATAAEWSELERRVTQALATRPPSMRRQLGLFVRVLQAASRIRYRTGLAGLDSGRRTALLEKVASVHHGGRAKREHDGRITCVEEIAQPVRHFLNVAAAVVKAETGLYGTRRPIRLRPAEDFREHCEVQQIGELVSEQRIVVLAQPELASESAIRRIPIADRPTEKTEQTAMKNRAEES